MPSEVMDIKGLSSSSFFSEDFPNERQVGFWKSDNMPDKHAGEKSLASSSLENCQTVKSLDHPDFFLMPEQKVKPSFNRQAVGAERALSHSLNLSRAVSLDSGVISNVNVETASYYAEGGKVNMMGTQYESSLFSSSLSELFSRKLRLSSNNTQYGHSVDSVASNYEEEEVFESLEEMEAQTIGNLLPDDDELLSGVTDGLEYNVPLTAGDDIEELDFFSSSGGMDLGDDGLSAGLNNSDCPGGVSNVLQCSGSVAGEHPNGEHPSRTLFVRNINSNIEDSELRTLFEQYGDIRTLYTACKHRGFVMISYYDIRAASNAMKALQNKPLRRRKLDIHYSIPKDNPSEKDVNQGTLVVFNLDSSVSNDELSELFGVYGEIKEIRETPNRSHHKFIEFYDVRAAESALNAMNRSDIAGKRIKLEPSRPGGAKRSSGLQLPQELEQDDCGLYFQQSSPPSNSVTGFSDNGAIMTVHSSAPSFENMFHHGISSSVPNSLSSMMRVESAVSQSGLTESIHSASPLKFDIHGSPAFHPHSLPEYHNGLTNGINCNSTGSVSASINVRPPDNRHFTRVSSGHSRELNDSAFGSMGNVNCPIPGHHYAWNNSFQSQAPGMMWPNSPSFVNGISAAHPSQRMHGLPRAPSHMLNAAMPINKHHVGSAPGANPMWDRRQAYAGESPESSGFHPGSLGNMRMPNNSPHSLEFVSRNMFPHVNGNGMDLPIPHKNVGPQAHHQRCMMYPGRSQMVPVMNSFDQPTERPRSRRNEGSSNQVDNKKQYELDIDRIMRGDDNRTTLMIKNIPNKYTSKMLLAAIDERHRGTYDFIYLPIDFKNKCNVGYAFINMTDPRQIVPFYQSFNGKKWEKFNSEKVASIAYARIQGKAALIAHFQNSSLMNEDKRCRPILFNTDGPNAGDQVPFPMGVNVRTRPGKSRTTTQEESHGGSPPNSGDGEHSCNGGSSAGSKDSD
ncbi:putative RNA recognition motif 2, nucleotide-binding alpha-beta plait domain-containing protein [Rosa chinensis]|uniref:Putative RNA recognition motif 2, nucleotide-binding alpha-beta plait domain-containing protein n=1 Tax=Rosa chinensis TaxID=74649 RepID=A0A2P6R055_ROSCH|nr:protein MEI2-like 4 isoform X2 [Rosa chinensis]PRQ39776.1 putative RNA recognition motif 2, nucleotide-binding alpha-beta plait domain-containing protein [Rosa chinensis]